MRPAKTVEKGLFSETLRRGTEHSRLNSQIRINYLNFLVALRMLWGHNVACDSCDAFGIGSKTPKPEEEETLENSLMSAEGARLKS